MIFQSENRNRANIYATLWMYCVWYFFVLHCAETMMISFGYSRQTFPDADDNDGLYYVEIIWVETIDLNCLLQKNELSSVTKTEPKIKIIHTIRVLISSLRVNLVVWL